MRDVVLKDNLIGIPHGTRLEAIIVADGYTDIWIAIKCRDPDYSKWQGTFISINHRDGTADRITIDDAIIDGINIFKLKEG